MAEPNGKPAVARKRSWPGWTMALRNFIQHPDSPESKEVILRSNDDIMVLRDKFPKAKVHMLVVPRQVFIDTPNDLLPAHLPLVEKMYSEAQKLISEFTAQDATLTFRAGFHSKPSMRQLHMHVISQDFQSPSLKNAKHWNSFVTPFFVEATVILDKLRQHQSPQIDEEAQEELLEAKPQCPKCKAQYGSGPKQIIALKDHYRVCQVNN